MSYEDDIFYLEPDDGSRKGFRKAAAERAARADAEIADLKTAMQRQANAVKMLDMSHVARAETMMQHAQVLHDQSKPDALESERAANAILTAEIAELRRLLGECRQVIAWEYGVLDADPRGRESEHAALGALVQAIDAARGGE